jgi:hypothetical protein
MAFVRKSGSRFQVRHGVTGELLSSHGSQSAANKRIEMLHKKNKPKSTNRGTSARSRHNRRK